MAPYREQFDRVKRWHVRFQAINDGTQAVSPSNDRVDDIYAFFQNCYHLKDWIKHDPSVPAPVRKVVEAHVNSERSLKLCADLCNALKHLSRDKSDRSKENPDFGKKVIKMELGPGFTTTAGLNYEIETDNGPIDAFVLATQCVSAWETFLSQHKLI